jgi:prephenate dehydrogenase
LLKDKTVCIVGLGLMGGSLGLALRGKCRAVTGLARRQETIAEALALAAIDAGTTDEREALSDADVVVLATPVRTILALIPVLSPLMRPRALLTDLGSTKVEVLAALDQAPSAIDACGGHPLCGREMSGLSAAQRDLYQDKVYAVTPGRGTSSRALALTQEIAIAAGARPLEIGAEQHDRLVAAISHLPYVQAAGLAAAAGSQAALDARTWQLAASGFRDTARLAASDVEMMLDILMTNSGNVSGLARQTASWLSELALALESKDDAAARQALSQARGAIMAYRLARPADAVPGAPPPGVQAPGLHGEEKSPPK